MAAVPRDPFVVVVFAVLALLLVTGCLCRPKDIIVDDDSSNSSHRGSPSGADTSVTSAEAKSSSLPSGRTSRLQQQPSSQVLNIGFDEIVVESNLQVHNRVGNKNKSKIMLPSNSTTAQASRSRSLEI